MKTIFILTENFYPAYKAGGPIQSLTNLILALEHNYNFYMATAAYDIRSTVVLENIEVDKWNEIMLPNSQKVISVWYAGGRGLRYHIFKKLIANINPDYIYINGMFSLHYFLIPLIALQSLKPKSEIVICPRGMIQKGALLGKSFKKKLYLQALHWSGLLNKVKWHATNLEEKKDIIGRFRTSNNIIIALNIPKKPLERITFLKKLHYEGLKLIYLSLLAEKKNLIFLLEIIKCTQNIFLDIYGPVKDIAYWNECEILINQMPGKVKYCGDVLPINVQKTLSQYHALALLTKGENFGHALYESLSVGRPIITSNYTPWKNLQQQHAGWNVDIKNASESAFAFKALAEMAEDGYIKFCQGAYKLARDYYNSLQVNENYGRLFN